MKAHLGRQPGQATSSQVKLGRYFPNFIEQTAHCDHKPQAARQYSRPFSNAKNIEKYTLGLYLDQQPYLHISV